MDRKRMNDVIAVSRNSLENIYLAGYDDGQGDSEREYAVNVLSQLANILRGEIKDRGPSSYVADGVWIALKEIDDFKDYIGAGGDCNGK